MRLSLSGAVAPAPCALVATAVAGLAACAPAAPSPCESCLPRAWPAGTTPNDVVLSTCDQRPVAVVADSGEARLHAIALDDGSLWATTLFEVEEEGGAQRFASPWSVAVTPDGARAAVTLFGQDRVAWVDPCAGLVLSTAAVPGAVTPQPVAIAAGRVVAAFTNVRTFSFDGEPPALDAGVVASFLVVDDRLTLDRTESLPCKNPQGLTAAPPELVVSCSGPLARGPDGGQEAVEDGAIVRLDANTLQVKHMHPAGRLAPGTAAVIGRTVVAGSLVDPLLLSMPWGDGAPADAPVEASPPLPGVDVDALFEAIRWGDDTAIVTQFSTDALLVVDVREGVRVVRAVPVGPGGDAFRGLLAVDVRRDIGAADHGIDAVGLLGLSAEVVPLRLAEIFASDMEPGP